MQPSYTMVDLSLGYHAANGQWYIEAFGTNATDEEVKTEAFYGAPVTSYKWGDPQEYGVRFGFRYK